MRGKPDISGSMSIENTHGCHCLYWYYLEHIQVENPQNGNTDISAMPSDLLEHRDTEA
jgi:hypothetical protein